MKEERTELGTIDCEMSNRHLRADMEKAEEYVHTQTALDQTI